MTLLFVKRLYDTFEEMLRSCDKKVGVRRKLMRIKIGITFSFLKNKDGPSFLKHQKILAKRLIKYVENY
jgi:hypothetical protein